MLRRRRERREQCSSNARAPDPQLVALSRSTLNLHSNPLRRRLHWHSQRNPRAKVKNIDNRRSLRRKSVLCRASRLRKHVVRSPAPSYRHLETSTKLLSIKNQQQSQDLTREELDKLDLQRMLLEGSYFSRQKEFQAKSQNLEGGCTGSAQITPFKFSWSTGIGYGFHSFVVVPPDKLSREIL